MTEGYQGSLVNEETYRQGVEHIKQLDRSTNRARWDIGDQTVDLIGAGNKVGIRNLARDVGYSERWIDEARRTSLAFPSETRSLQDAVPWRVYQAASSHAELKLDIVERYAERRRSEDGGPGRVNSEALLAEVIREVRREKGVPPRSVRQSETAALGSKVNKWVWRWNHGRIDNPNLSDLRDLRASLEEALEVLSHVRGL